MTTETPTAVAPAGRLRALLAEKPDGIVEALAREAGTTARAVLEALGGTAALFVPAERWDAIWTALTDWEEVLLIVHTGTVVLEVTGPLPAGSSSHGWFNVHGDGPIGGHFRQTACAAIAFVDRPFHGRRSCSIWFMDEDGEAMFKIFVPRAPDRTLKAPALAAFEALRAAETRR